MEEKEPFDKNDTNERKKHSKMQSSFVLATKKRMENAFKLGGNMSLLILGTEVGENKVIYCTDTLHSSEMENMSLKIIETMQELMRQNCANERSNVSYYGKVSSSSVFEVVLNILKTLNEIPSQHIFKQIAFQALQLESSFSQESLKTFAITISENNGRPKHKFSYSKSSFLLIFLGYLKINQNYELTKKFYATFVAYSLVLILKTDVVPLNLDELVINHHMLSSIFRVDPDATVSVPPNVDELNKFPDNLRDQVFELMKINHFIIEL